MVFDREGYSPDLFEAMRLKRIAILSYHKFPEDDWRPEEFTTHSVRLAAGEVVTMQLAERGSIWPKSCGCARSANWGKTAIRLRF